LSLVDTAQWKPITKGAAVILCNLSGINAYLLRRGRGRVRTVQRKSQLERLGKKERI